MYKLLLTHRVPEIVFEKYSGIYELISPPEGSDVFTWEQVKNAIADCDAMFSMGSFPVKAELLAAAEKLRAVGTLSTGYDHIDIAACNEKGVVIINTPLSVCESTAEFSVALILGITKGIAMFDRDLRKMRLCKTDLFFDRDILISGKTVGILGFGRIGQAVCRKLQSLGVRVVYYSPRRLTTEQENELNAVYLPMDDLLRTADVITCHMSLSDKTYHLIDDAAFAKMKPTAYFINVSRGKTMDENALLKAVREKKIRGAALDVFEFEPYISKEMASYENILITPHAGTSVLEVRLNMVHEAFTGLYDVLNGGCPHNIVNTEPYARNPI